MDKLKKEFASKLLKVKAIKLQPNDPFTWASVLDGTFTEEKKDEWDERLATVFNRGFWDGYYQGQTLGEWNKHYGSVATEKKVLVGKVMKYFSKLVLVLGKKLQNFSLTRCDDYSGITTLQFILRIVESNGTDSTIA